MAGWNEPRPLLGLGNLDKDESVANDVALAESVFALTDALPFKTIGDAFHTFSPDELVSEVEVNVDLVGSSVMTTTSQWQLWQDRFLEVTVETTQAVHSSLAQLLPLPGTLDGSFKFPSGLVLELAKPGSSTVLSEVTYLSENFRVNRIEDKVFVYRKVF